MRTEYLLEKELELLLQLLMPQNRLVMRVCLSTGLRVGDALELKPEQLKRNIWITERKTKKRRQIGFSEPLVSDLKANAGTKWVFPGRNPENHLTRQAVWKDVKRASQACRLCQNIGPHSMRKVYAVELMKKYGDIERVQRAMRHDDVCVTMLYAMADQQLEAKNKRRRAKSGRRAS